MCLAVPGKIISIENDDDLLRTGRVDFGGIIKQINLAFVPEAKRDNYILVHAGFAIGMIDEENARQTLSDLERLFGDNN
jgi:hydrogenase expression/formation protein HypC